MGPERAGKRTITSLGEGRGVEGGHCHILFLIKNLIGDGTDSCQQYWSASKQPHRSCRNKGLLTSRKPPAARIPAPNVADAAPAALHCSMEIWLGLGCEESNKIQYLIFLPRGFPCLFLPVCFVPGTSLCPESWLPCQPTPNLYLQLLLPVSSCEMQVVGCVCHQEFLTLGSLDSMHFCLLCLHNRL